METASKVKELIYNKSPKEVLDELERIEDADFFHVYMANYNWDNGFEIPKKIISKDCCELSTALMIFYLGDGIRYLENREEVENSSLTVWSTFLRELYSNIMKGKYAEGNIFFEPPLSKVQLYKIKKVLTENEEVFVKTHGDRKLDILV